MTSKAFLEAVQLSKVYPFPRGWRREGRLLAVDSVSLVVPGGRSVGIVGESGCGKSTLLKLLLCLEKPASGSLLHRGIELTVLPGKALRFYRRRVQAIFQDPASSLNQRFRVGEIILEPLINFGLFASRRKAADYVGTVLEQVGLQRADRHRYPHEFSGGQQRRIAIARAIAVKPELVICDEATSGLDVSVQAQILNLLADLRAECGINYLFVSHDLAAVRYLCPDLAVMYAGRIVELLPVDRRAGPVHPYTRALLAGELSFENSAAAPSVMPGEPPDASAYPPGCRFHPRCPEAIQICREVIPELTVISRGHLAACHRTAGQDTQAK